jgi:predicted MFS family arabinose efflux permease
LTGLAAYYASWRIMQLAIALAGAIAWAGIAAFFPETMHPNTRGIDKQQRETGRDWTFEFINPLSPLWLLRSPLLMAVVSCHARHYCTQHEVELISAFQLALCC